jgi:hypothetical protein
MGLVFGLLLCTVVKAVLITIVRKTKYTREI